VTDMTSDIQMIPVDQISVLNPRARNKKIFGELVTSIERLGLKKPITVARRDGEQRFDLVCGQGRLEAYLHLGQVEIPAVVIDASHEDCFVMSLVENLARRQHSPLELLREFGGLRERGYSLSQIAAKTGFSDEYVSVVCYLLEHGEGKLLAAVDRGEIPATIAMEIAKASDHDVQRALAEAYESRALPGNQVVAIRRIIEQRKSSGKEVSHNHRGSTRPKKRVSAESLVRAYRKETQRQKLLIRRATLSQTRLLFVINALRRLLDDENFVTLLRAEEMLTLPKPLADRIAAARG